MCEWGGRMVESVLCASGKLVVRRGATTGCLWDEEEMVGVGVSCEERVWAGWCGGCKASGTEGEWVVGV